MPRPSSILAAVAAAELREFLPEPFLDELRALAPRFAHLDTLDLSVERFHRALADADPEVVVACWSTPPLPATLPSRLRYVAYLCGSIRQLVERRHIEDGLLVTNWGGSISRIVAEGTLVHILNCLRQSRHWMSLMHLEGGWKSDDRGAQPSPASLFGRRVGIHGFGYVARELVRLLRPFDCTISVFAPDVDPKVEADHGITRAESLESLLSNNDVVVELAPLIPETSGIITERLLRLIPAGGVFVNTGRGAVVDPAALERVAREGRIAFGLDVFDVEPLPADSPLRSLPNVCLTPHIAGQTLDRFPDAGEFLVRNVRAYCEGGHLQALFTPERYDRIT
ncbi:MAG TPA: hydroxyacid dehydrogenase [Opitutaceae bacterium]